MSQTNPGDRLHLPNLSIDNFRGIDHLSIPRLGRVTLLAGRNGIGKTTILDAIRIYATRGRPAMLAGLLKGREEFTVAINENDDNEDGDGMLLPDISALFHGRRTLHNSALSIGYSDEEDRLEIGIVMGRSSMEAAFIDTFVDPKTTAIIKITSKSKKYRFLWSVAAGDLNLRIQLRRIQKNWFDDKNKLPPFDDEDEWPPAVECESLGPGLPGNTDMVRFWDRITLTDSENLPVHALQLILGNPVHRIAAVGDDGPRIGKTGRRIIVRLPGAPTPVPLKSLGDGAIRLFGVALALANSLNGFLLIDEAENGIHYSVQRDYWRMILQTAHKDNVQVVATTHSRDCINGFARAAMETEDAEGVLVRLERDDDGMRAIEYSEDELRIAAEQGIEVR